MTLDPRFRGDERRDGGLDGQALDIPLEPEQRASVRRLARRAMAMLDYDRIWTGPMGQVATEAAVVRSVEIMVRSGEHDESVILERVLRVVCGGQLTHVLRATLAARDGEAAVRRDN